MKTPFREIPGGVTAAADFRAAGIAAGIKKSGKPDLALIFSDAPAAVAGVFTSNAVKAAPLKVTIPRVIRGRARAIIANSGNANCCTGAQGVRDAEEMCALTAAALNSQIPRLQSQDVLVCSTGPIGRLMPMEKVRAALPRLVAALSPQGGPAAARAIMTTDTFPKECAVEFKVGGKHVRLGGACKGAGMIAPRMTSPHATMLCFLTTDAGLEPRALQTALNAAVAQSFHCVTVDGDMSTNDTVILLANGAGAAIGERYDRIMFQAVLNHVTLTLARMIARDGEGATKQVTIRVEGARTDADAALAARAIAESPLNKCSFAGGDPNWGRLMDALGYSGARVEETKVEIRYDGVLAVKNGIEAAGDERRRRIEKIAAQKEFTITLHLHLGRGAATMHTCDLTERYVRENLGE